MRGEKLAMATAIAITQTGPNKSSLPALLYQQAPRADSSLGYARCGDPRSLGDLRPYRDVSAKIRLVVNSRCSF